MTGKDPRAELVSKALKDPSFRAELKKDPAAAIEKAVGVKLPDGVTVKVVEDSASVVHLVLPPAAQPLSEGNLGKVSGGAGTDTIGSTCENNSRTTIPKCSF